MERGDMAWCIEAVGTLAGHLPELLRPFVAAVLPILVSGGGGACSDADFVRVGVLGCLVRRSGRVLSVLQEVCPWDGLASATPPVGPVRCMRDTSTGLGLLRQALSLLAWGNAQAAACGSSSLWSPSLGWARRATRGLGRLAAIRRLPRLALSTLWKLIGRFVALGDSAWLRGGGLRKMGRSPTRTLPTWGWRR